MKKILVVDDSAFARAILAQMLRRAGYEVFEASGGLQALEMMGEVQPDLVTLDLLMPSMEGDELLGHMLRLGHGCPFVIISANIRTIIHDELIAAGAAGFLSKPVKEEDLFALLLRLLPPDAPQDGV